VEELPQAVTTTEPEQVAVPANGRQPKHLNRNQAVALFGAAAAAAHAVGWM
jgi:hypothetical protein